jgi:hypothetical protein
MKKLFFTLMISAFIASSYTNVSYSPSGKDGNGKGYYKNGKGSSHNGGKYKNSSTNDHHKKRK